MGDDIAELVAGFFVLTLVLAVIAGIALVASFVVVPVGLVGAGTLYYLYNVHLPEKRRREARARTEALYKRAEDLSPAWQDLEEALLMAGVESALLHRVAKTLYDQEGLRPPILPPVGDDQIKLARYQDTLERYIQNAQPERFDAFQQQLVWALSDYEPASPDEPQMFRSDRRRTKLEIERLMLRFVNDEGLFAPLVTQLNENFAAEGEVYPSKSKHDDYAWRYLKGTPLLEMADVSEEVSLSDRMYHTYLLGSSGSGKTVMLENIIAHDLQSDEDCCIVVIDSQTQLTDKLARLDLPDTIYITPQFELALNLFDVGYDEMKDRGIEGETLINKTVGLLSFVLEGMMGAEFTNPQKTIFQYVIQLVISIPGGNIHTFMDVLAADGHERHAKSIAALDDNLQRFFTVDFPSPEYKRTREAIRRRLESLLLNPTFRRLFSATENPVNMANELEHQKLIIIDTNKPMLDEAASAFFGRLFIALILRASHQRMKSGQTSRPVYVIVDEAHEYFDKSVSDMLEQARKANIGLIVAHQSLSQSRGGKGGSNIADPLMVNTGTKFIWTSFRDDAAKFAGSMQIKPEEILSLPQFTFGLHSRQRGFTPVRGKQDPFAEFEKRQDQSEFQALMESWFGPPKNDEDTESQNKTEDQEEGEKEVGETKAQQTPLRSKEELGAPPDVETI